MVEINSIEDLKPYMKYISSKYTNGKYSYVVFDVSKNGELEDIAINCNLNLVFSLDNVFNNIFNIEDIFAEDYMAEYCEIKLIAKDIYIKNELCCDCIECDNLYSEDKVSCSFLVANNIVKAKSVSAIDIMCYALEADYVSCPFLNVINFQATTLYSDDLFFSNLTFHQPDFAEDLLKIWHGERLKKSTYTQEYNLLPF